MRTCIASCFAVLSLVSHTQAALFLSGTSYTQNFDGLGSGLPNGWSVNAGATASSLGSSGTFSTTAVSWGNTGGAFKNCASADGLASGASTTVQSASADRALAIRQTQDFGDPGAAFVLKIENTKGFADFTLQLQAQMLSVQDRSTTWTLDYRVGESGSFTSLGTYSDPGTFGSTTISFGSSSLSAWNNQDSAIYFRVVALSAATGANNRDTFGIDDFSLTFSAVPEPPYWGLASAVGLLSVYGLRAWSQSCRAKRLSLV